MGVKFFLLIALMLLIGCDANLSFKKESKLFTHKNGLTFKYNDPSVRLSQTSNGFVLYLSPENSRQQNQIIIEYQAEKPPLATDLKEIAGQKIYFHQELVVGASGGDERILTLWKTIDAKKGVYIQHTCQSDTVSDFSSTWDLIINVK